jgi:hypothetical protein
MNTPKVGLKIAVLIFALGFVFATGCAKKIC